MRNAILAFADWLETSGDAALHELCYWAITASLIKLAFFS